MVKVVCHITGDNITGTFHLTQLAPRAPTVIDATVKGLPKGKHGISINVFGDLTDGFNRCGPHYNPKGRQHGPPYSNERHVGSLGNIESDGETAAYHLEDMEVTIIGPYSVIGRSIVIYENEDDMGKGSYPNSLVDGNVGNPIAGGLNQISFSVCLYNMGAKKKRPRKNKKWIPYKELTSEEREQLRRDSDKKRFRKQLMDNKLRVAAAKSSGNHYELSHAPRPTNEDYLFNEGETRRKEKWDVESPEEDEESFDDNDISWGQQDNFVNPENLDEDKRIQDETTVEKVRRQHRRIIQLQKENEILKAELRDLEHLMKQYALGLQ